MFDKLDLQKEFANQLAPYLERFQLISYTPFKAIFRCPICGDSQKNKYKRRGYILEKDGGLIFHCHNECGSFNFEKFLEQYYESLHKDYRFEVIKQWKKGKGILPQTQIVTPSKKIVGDLDGLVSARGFPLLLERKLPDDDLYIAKDFFAYINRIVPDKFPGKKAEPRLVIPLRREDGSLYGVTGRAVTRTNNAKYLTIKFDEDHPKIWGLDRLDRDQHAYVLEGPLDAMLIPNAVALLGTDGKPEEVFGSNKDYTIVLDNQPRAENVLKKYAKYIEQGRNIVVWPKQIEEKDINDMVLVGIDPLPIIKDNTFSGLKALIKFNEWKKA